MGKVLAKNAVIMVGGYNVSTYGSSYTLDYNNEILEATGFGDGWRNYIPGIHTGQMGINFYWGAATGQSFDAIMPLGEQCVTVIPQGYTLGTTCLSMYATSANLTPGGSSTGILQAGNITFSTNTPDGGPLPSQALYHDTITGSGDVTGFGDMFVGSGTVTKRCRGTLHVWTAMASDTAVIKIQHATSVGGAYADLVTFTALNGSAIGSEVVAVASGSVREFRRLSVTVTGAGNQPLGLTVTFWRDY